MLVPPDTAKMQPRILLSRRRLQDDKSKFVAK